MQLETLAFRILFILTVLLSFRFYITKLKAKDGLLCSYYICFSIYSQCTLNGQNRDFVGLQGLFISLSRKINIKLFIIFMIIISLLGMTIVLIREGYLSQRAPHNRTEQEAAKKRSRSRQVRFILTAHCIFLMLVRHLQRILYSLSV